jgi:DNA-binding NarL/FixJ family response regulator
VTSVLICDQMPVMRDGIRALLSAKPDIEVIGTTDSGMHAVTLVRQRRPDVVITGLTLRGIPGLEMIRRVREETLADPVQSIVFTMDDSSETIAETLHAGACGILSPDSSSEEFTAAVYAAARGQAMLAPRVTKRLIDWYCRREHEPEERLQPFVGALTPKEREVLLLFAKGHSTDQVARQLSIGIATVRTHVYRLRNKLELKDRAQLVSFAYRAGLMRPT